MTTALDGQGLLRDVIDRPEDGTPRLIYADWCEDSGQHERAEFIRLGVAHGGWQGEGGPVGHEGAILIRHHAEWLGRMGGLIQPHWRSGYEFGYGGTARVRWRWRRGFVEGVSLPLQAFMDHAAALFSTHPITAVTLTDRTPDFTQTHGATPVRGWYRAGKVSGPPGPGLPRKLWKHLDDYRFYERRLRWYLSEEKAHAALSHACVRYGRDAAKTPA